MLKIKFDSGIYMVSALDDAGANWLRRAKVQSRLLDTECSVDPRFINEFIDTAEAAGIYISLLDHTHRDRAHRVHESENCRT